MMSKKVAAVAIRSTVIRLFGAKNEKIAVEPEYSVEGERATKIRRRFWLLNGQGLSICY